MSKCWTFTVSLSHRCPTSQLAEYQRDFWQLPKHQHRFVSTCCVCWHWLPAKRFFVFLPNLRGQQPRSLRECYNRDNATSLLYNGMPAFHKACSSRRLANLHNALQVSGNSQGTPQQAAGPYNISYSVGSTCSGSRELPHHFVVANLLPLCNAACPTHAATATLTSSARATFTASTTAVATVSAATHTHTAALTQTPPNSRSPSLSPSPTDTNAVSFTQSPVPALAPCPSATVCTITPSFLFAGCVSWYST